MPEGDPTTEGQRSESGVARIIDLRKTLRKEESALFVEIRAVKEEWKAWALAQAGYAPGRFEGVFIGSESDGNPFRKRVLVRILSGLDGSSWSSKLRLGKMFVLDEIGEEINEEATGAMMESEKFSVGRVIPGSVDLISDIRFIAWGASLTAVGSAFSPLGSNLIDFDAITKGYPNEAPDFAAIANRELNWLSNSVGKLTYTERKF